MPVNRRYRKSRRKIRGTRRMKRVMKRRARLPSFKPMSIMGVGFPQKVMVKHRYTQQYNMVNTVSGSTSLYAISANGMFAPTITIGVPNSHQPLYFDQYANIYDHYVVIASKCTFKIANNTGAAAGAYTVCALLDDNSALLSTDAPGVAEQTQGRRLLLFSGNENDSKRITVKFSAKRTYGGSILSNNEIQGSATTNPSETSTFALVITNPGGGAHNCLVTAEVEYIAIWKELREIAQS